MCVTVDESLRECRIHTVERLPDGASGQTMLNRMQLLTLAVVALFAVVLSGCGGGGAGIRPVADDPPMPPSPTPIADRNFPGGIPDAARNRPHAGESVVQSSNSANGVTIDDISVQVSFRPGGHIRYRVANDDEWFLSSDDSETETIANRRGQLPASGSTVAGVLATKGASDHTGDAAANIDDGVGLVMYTDIESTADTDYLVWGVWVDAPDNVTTHKDIVHGAFASGHDPLRQDNLVVLTGTVRYQGDVSGMYFEPSEQPLGGYSFEARVMLEANFGDGRALGTISGIIDNFRFQTNSDGTRQPRPRTMVTLERADIGGTDSGFFEGTSTGSYHDGTPLSGRWGGRFYGNTESDGKPGSVAGTFGSVSDDRGLIGAFGAHRQ